MGTKLLIVAVFSVLAFLLAIISPAIGAIVSTNREFNSTQDSIFLNFTNSYSQNITLWSNASYALVLNISNSSTAINANYSQSNSQFACQYPNIGFLARNASANLVNQANLSAVGNNINITIVFNTLSCLPGRYWGGFVIKNSTNATENLTINADIQIPISASNYNTLPQTGLATFTASMPGNASAFHRYYFNTSEIANATSITLNLSAAQDMDIFLFDNSAAAKLLAKSINKSNSTEWLTFWPLTPNAMYEIRIFGNITNASSTSYTFYTIFSTLNATYTSDAGTLASNLSFGSLSTSMKNIQNITLKNEGNITMSNVAESKEIYYVKRWLINNSGSSNGFDGLFLVPSFATKIKVAVNWTDSAQNYTLYLTAPNKTVIGFSNSSFFNANATNASLEEYFETANIVSGYWNASVRNKTVIYTNYTLTAYVWYPASDWIITNYSNMTFNTTGNNNSSTNISVNFTASNNSIDGNYEGFLQYATAQGAALRVPFSASVNASSLVVNNTIGSASVQIDENIGANLTKVLNIALNNTGSYPLSFSLENSTNNSFALWNGIYFMNFTYNITSSPLLPGANHVMNISVTLDPNTTRNATGIYEGYIKFATNDSRPYQNSTLTLRVNLTNDLNIAISSIASVDGDTNWINQTGVAENFTTLLKVYYVNGTEIGSNILNTSNFTSAWLTSANVSYRIPTSGSMSIYNGTNPIYITNYNLNLTVPAGQPGGIYQLHVAANYYRGDQSFDGEGVYNYLYINQTGLSMSTNSSTSVSIANTSTSIFYANVSNYGNLAGSSATIQFSESCSGYSAAVNSSTGCTASQSGTTFTISPLANSNSCMVWWTITAGSGAADACTANIIGAVSGNTWYDTRGINVSVTVTAPSSSSSNPSSNPGSNPNTTTVSALSITKYPAETKIAQNSSKTINISVKDSGDTNLAGVKVYVDGISQGWYSTSPAQDINKNVEKNYSITFNIPASASVASYSIKYVANNSAASKSVSASLVVLPSNQTSAQIAANITNLTSRYEDVYLLLNQTKAKGANLTDAEALLKQAKDLIDKANNYTKSGDYFSAYQLVGQIEGLIRDTEAKISEAKQKLERQAGDFWFWVAAGIVIVAIAGFVIYITLPPKQSAAGGFKPSAGLKYNFSGRGDRLASLREKLRGAKWKIKDIKEKLKEILKRKQKTVQPAQQPQPFVYKGTPLGKD